VFFITDYWAAIICCIFTMLFWGSWPSLQRMSKQPLPFQYFYWDYIIGMLLVSVLLALTLGSIGQAGRSFVADVMQMEWSAVALVSLSAIIWN